MTPWWYWVALAVMVGSAIANLVMTTKHKTSWYWTGRSDESIALMVAVNHELSPDEYQQLIAQQLAEGKRPLPKPIAARLPDWDGIDRLSLYLPAEALDLLDGRDPEAKPPEDDAAGGDP